MSPATSPGWRAGRAPGSLSRVSRRFLYALGLAGGLAGLGLRSLGAVTGLTDRFIVTRWEIEDGLPQSGVRALAQTPDDYLWAGTWNGLARFDGDRFVTFAPGRPSGLEFREVSALHCDRAGRL